MTPDDVVLVSLCKLGQVVAAEKQDAILVLRQVKAENWLNFLRFCDLFDK